MPKFILLSAHGEIILPLILIFSQFVDFKTFHPKPSSMFFVNFFECETCYESDRFSVEISYYPHDSDYNYEDQVLEVANLSLDSFIEWIEYQITSYLKELGLNSLDMHAICNKDYKTQ